MDAQYVSEPIVISTASAKPNGVGVGIGVAVEIWMRKAATILNPIPTPTPILLFKPLRAAHNRKPAALPVDTLLLGQAPSAICR
jgi:hypothetical protein